MESNPQLDLDDAISSILADSDEDDNLSKKKRTSLKKKLDHNKNAKSLNSKALIKTSSVGEEDFYKNLSKIAEEPRKDDDDTGDVVITEDDAKKMASDLAALDDLDADLLGSLKTKPPSPRNKQTKDQDNEKQKDGKRKTSTGSLHRKGSVTPLNGEGDDEDVLGDLVLSDDESEDALNSSVNSSTRITRHRKTGGSKKSPNKISPRVSFDDVEKDTNSTADTAKDINFDSDSDLPDVDNHKARPVATRSSKKKSVKNKREKKKVPKERADLFGDDDDLPDLDGVPENKSQRSALDSLMGNKSKVPSQESRKKTPASLDEFMAKVSTVSKPQAKSEIQSPVKSPTTEETFQFGGYMPSAGSGRRSRSNRPDSAMEFGRRSVKFSDDLGLDDDDMFSVKKRPSTAPGGRKKNNDADDLLTRSLPSKTADKSDWLGLEDENEDSEDKKNHQEGKADDFSPQSSLQGSKSSSTGADWLGLGDDVNDSLQLPDANPYKGGVELKQDVTSEISASPPRQQPVEKKDDGDEFSKMIDMVPDENKHTVATENKFPWDSGKSSGGGRRRGAAASSSKQESQKPELDDELKTATRKDQDSKTNTTTEQSRTLPDQNLSSLGGLAPSVSPDNRSPKSTPFVDPVPGGTAHQQQLRPQSDAHVVASSQSQRTSGHMLTGLEGHYRSELDKQKNGIEVELRGMMDRVQEMETGKHQVELELADKLAAFETKIRWLEIENENLKKTSELSKERHQDEISSSENSHRIRVQAVEESYQRREARQKEETELLITKHRESIRQIEAEKSDLQAANTRKISAFESSKVNEIERLNNLHRQAVEELRSEHEAEVDHLKKMKEQEVSATVTAFSHTKSLQTLMEQVLNSTKQVDDLHHLVEVSHKTSQQERDMSAKAKDEYLNQLHDRLLKQQTENEEERSRLQSLVAKMEIHVREQNRKLEEDKWKLNQEDSRLKCLRDSLEEERKMTREQIDVERVLLQRTKDEFLTEQKRMMIEVNEERRMFTMERAELTAAQRGILNTEKLKKVNSTKMDLEQESARIRLVEDTAVLNSQETHLRREQEDLKREKREFTQKQEKWDAEKEHVNKLGFELEKRAQQIEEISLEAAKVREDGTKSLETAHQMQSDIAKQANDLESKVLLLQEKERQIAAERFAMAKERRELEMEKRRGSCVRCSQSPLAQTPDSNGKWETPPRPLFTSDSTPPSTFRSSVELVSSPPITSALPPDILANTLELKRTFRRWSHDKEQDEEFLAKESEFLSSLHNSRQHSQLLTNTQ